MCRPLPFMSDREAGGHGGAWDSQASEFSSLGPLTASLMSQLPCMVGSPAMAGSMPQARDTAASPERPKSARYMRRWTSPSTRGTEMSYRAPSASPQPTISPSSLARPHSSPFSGKTKTERWREVGVVRWPAISEGQELRKPSDGTPVRQFSNHMQNRWQGELWTRSLRKPGVFVQHPIFGQTCTGAKDLHQDWADLMPQSAREWPYSGSTPSGKASIANPINVKLWVERPVATGKMALEHMEGKRYRWDTKERSCMTDIRSARLGHAGLERPHSVQR